MSPFPLFTHTLSHFTHTHTFTMNSSTTQKNYRRQSGSRSKVQLALDAENAERERAIRQQRHREYLAREERRQRKKRNTSSNSTPSNDSKSTSSDRSKPAWKIEAERQRKAPSKKSSQSTGNFEGNTFFRPGAKRLTKESGKSQSLGSILPGLEEQLNKLSFVSQPPPSARPQGWGVSKSAFAALDTDSEDDEDDEDTTPAPSVGDKTSALTKMSAQAWGGFRQGIVPKDVPKYQRKPAAGTTVLKTTEEPEEQAEDSSDSEEEPTSYSTEGDYESEEEFDEDETVFDGLEDGEEITDSWDL